MGLAKNKMYKYYLHRLFYLMNSVSLKWGMYILIYRHKHIAYHATIRPTKIYANKFILIDALNP